DWRESRGRRGDIQQAIAERGARLFDALKLIAQPFVRFWVLEVALQICDAGEQPLGNTLIHLARRKLAQLFFQVGAKGIIREVLARNADHRERIGQKPAGSKIVERRNQQPASEIARSAED